MRVLLFAGTTEGRVIATHLAGMPGVHATICVATPYGRATLAPLDERFLILDKRLTQDEMQTLMQTNSFDLVVDATHPYAERVTDSIKAASTQQQLPYMRVLREEGSQHDYPTFASLPEAIEFLSGTTGNILVTTGSKELEAYTALAQYAERVFPRVLPMTESIETCEKLGFAPRNIVALQGPFDTDLNLALMKHYDIRWLITKNSGDAGGFNEKLEAAAQLHVGVVILGRPPQQDGVSLEQALAELTTRGEKSSWT